MTLELIGFLEWFSQDPVYSIYFSTSNFSTSVITQIIIKKFNIQKIIYKQSINWTKLIQYTSSRRLTLKIHGRLFIYIANINLHVKGEGPDTLPGSILFTVVKNWQMLLLSSFQKVDCFVGSKIFCEQNRKLNSDYACNSLPRILCISAEILICNTEKPKYTKLFSFWAAVKVNGGEIWGKAEGGGEEKKVTLRLHKPIRLSPLY